MTKELTLKGNYDLAAPSQMAQMAKLLQAHITKQGLSTNIVGKNYTNVEGWQFAGGLLGYMPRVVKVEKLSSAGTEKIWRADVELVRIKDDKVMGTGSAICSNAEAKKRTFDEYAIMSMAQTRAIGKAYRNLIGWVMKMAGYESTPSEEMLKVDQSPVQTKTSPAVKVATPETKTPATTDSDAMLRKLKEKLFKLGAKDEAHALRILFQKTGLLWKSFTYKGPSAIQAAYTSLLNSK